MALTRITKGVIKPNENYDTHNINSTGIVTAIGLDINGNGDVSGNLSVGGVLTYEDVTSIDSVGIITAKKDIHVGAGISVVGIVTAATFKGDGDFVDIDVDGHTNLDNVSIAGVTTCGRIDTGTINVSAHADIRFASGNWSGNTTKIQNHNNYLYIVAPSNGFQFRIGSTDLWLMDSISNDGNFWPTVDSGRDIGKSNRRVRNVYATTLHGSGDFVDIDVDGHTNLDNISIAGVTTVANDTYFTLGANATANTNLRIKHNSSNTRNEYRATYQDFFTTDLRIHNISNNAHFAYFWSNQISLFASGNEKLQVNSSGAKVLGNLELSSTYPSLTWTDTNHNSDFRITNDDGKLIFYDITNGAHRLDLYNTGNIKIYKDLEVDGHTNLDNVSIAGVSTFSGNLDANGLVYVRQNTSPTIYLTSTSTTGDCRLFFGDPDSTLVGRLTYVHNGDYFSFYAGYGERFRIAGNGDITITSIDGNATGPTLKLFHNSGTPAANDVVSRISMFGDDSAGNETEYGRIETKVDNVTDSQETGFLNFATRGLGSFANVFRIKRRSTGSAPSYTADDADGVILDVYNTGNPYPRYMNFIAKAAGNTDSNIGFWTEAVGGSPTEKLRISSNGDVRVGGGAPATFGSGTTVHETYNSSTYVANLVTSGTHQLQMIASQTHGATSIGTRSNHNLSLTTNDTSRLTIDTSGRVLIGGGSSPSQVGDGRLIVYADTRLHPAIKADCIDGGSNRANGFTLLADNYQADESICNFGISYSGAGLVLSRGVKVSNAADDTYLSSMDSFALRPCAIKLDDVGAFNFLSNETSATRTTDSAVTLTKLFTIDRVGNIYQRISGRNMYFGASNQLRIGVQHNGDSAIEAVSGDLKIMDGGGVITQVRSDGLENFQHVYPANDSQRDLGKDTKRWANAFVDLYFGSGQHLTHVVTAGSVYNSNLNTATTNAGVYRVNTGITNGHSGMTNYGTLFHANNVSDTGFQIYVNYNDGKGYLRGGNGAAVNGSGSMTGWGQIATSQHHFVPETNNTLDLGSAAKGWRNVYMNDLNLSNMNGNKNDIDGTQGSWTIQEGENDLFIINRLNGKKFKINMEEIS